MPKGFEARLREGYRAMSGRVQHALQNVEKGSLHTLEDALLQARDMAMTLGELTREEADFIAQALKRDVEDVSLSMMQAEAGLKHWAETDLTVAEQAFIQRVLGAADPTTLEWLHLREAWEERMVNGIHAGHEAGAGAYECVACGEIIHLDRAATVPPCPQCGGGRYRSIRSAVM